MAFVFSACGTPHTSNEALVPKDISSNKVEYTLWNHDGVYSFALDTNRDLNRIRTTSTIQDYKKALRLFLNLASTETKKMGYNYFAIVNSNINNLSGFPLNDVDNLSRYLSLKVRKPSFSTDGQERDPDSLISVGSINLHFKPVPQSVASNGIISVWEAKTY